MSSVSQWQPPPPPPVPPAAVPGAAVPAAMPGYSRGLARAIWVVGAVLVLGAALTGYVVIQASSSDAPPALSAPQTTAPGATEELAAQYSAIADEADAREAP